MPPCLPPHSPTSAACLPPHRRYIENVFEELDAPGEWFFDKAARKLYVAYNGSNSAPPPNDGSVIAIADGAWGLINVTATQVRTGEGRQRRGGDGAVFPVYRCPPPPSLSPPPLRLRPSPACPSSG